MFSSVQFKTEFCTQAQATIIPRVTMTQFMLMILAIGGSVIVLDLPSYLVPIPVILAYVAGYYHNGELMMRRARAWVIVWLRQLMQRQTQIGLEQQWQSVQLSSDRKRN